MTRPPSWGRIGLAAVAAIAIGEIAVMLLRPKVDLSGVDVSEAAYFSKAEIARARDFAGTQRSIGIGSTIAQGVFLVALVVFPPRRIVARLEWMGGQRPLVCSLIAGAGLAMALAIVALPFAAAAHERAVDFGLSSRDWQSWASDVALSTGITTLLAAGGAAIGLGLIRRSGRRWWLPGSAIVVGLVIVFVWLAPVAIAPLFNRYEDLPAGRERGDLIELARDNDVDVANVLVMDASRRTNAVNAYVTGIGPTKRIVVYDNLLRQYSPQQVRLVVAHELAHVKQRDVPRGIAWIVLFAPAALYLAMLLVERWSARAGERPGSIGSLPALALALAIVSTAGVLISNQLSRQVERRADEFALEATDEARVYVRLEQRLALSNLTDPSPPALTHGLFGTHPTIMQRIGVALAYERDRDRLKGD